MRRYELLWPWAVFAAVFAVLAPFAPDGFANGDAVVYAAQIRAANFAERTTHLGYYLVAYPVSLLPGSLSHALNLLSCAFAAGAAALLALLAEAVTGSRKIGLLAAGFAVSNTLVVVNALHAEVYMAQAFFLLAGLYLWQRHRAVAAGASLAVAFLITSSTALAGPYVLTMRPQWKPLLRLGGTAAVIAAAALAPVYDNYLFGARGLAAALEHGVDYKLAVLKTDRDVFYGYFALLPFLVAGIAECARRRELRRFGAALAALWATVFAFGEKFTDVPVQLPTYLLGAIVTAIGVQAAAAGFRRPATIGAFAAFVVIGAILAIAPYVPAAYADHLPGPAELAVFGVAAAATAAVLAFTTSTRALAAVVAVAVLCNLSVIVKQQGDIRQRLRAADAIARTLRETPNAAFVAKWNVMVRVNWLVHGAPYHADGFDLDELDGSYRSGEAAARFEQALGRKDALLLVDTTPGLERKLTGAGFARDRAGIFRRN